MVFVIQMLCIVCCVQGMYLDFTSRRPGPFPRYRIATPLRATKTDGTNKTSIDIACRKTIRNVTRLMRMDRIEKLRKMFPGSIPPDYETMMATVKKWEKEMNISRRNELTTKCNMTNMSQTIRAGVRRYIDKTAQRIHQCNGKRHQKTIKQKCSKEDATSFRCRFSPEQIDLGEHRYPRFLVHKNCTACKECMYAAGQCLQRTTNITIYEDTKGRKLHNLDKWDEITVELKTGCDCMVKDNTTLVAMLKGYCKDKKDPTKCFRAGN